VLVGDGFKRAIANHTASLSIFNCTLSQCDAHLDLLGSVLITISNWQIHLRYITCYKHYFFEAFDRDILTYRQIRGQRDKL
jgi:hypothetical protein